MSTAVTADDVLKHAKTMKGQTKQTLHHKKDFVVDVDGSHAIYTPKTRGIPRRHDHQTLQRICDEYNNNGGSLHPSDYDGCVTRNASYTLTIIDDLVKSQQNTTANTPPVTPPNTPTASNTPPTNTPSV